MHVLQWSDTYPTMLQGKTPLDLATDDNCKKEIQKILSWNTQVSMLSFPSRPEKKKCFRLKDFLTPANTEKC
jgi:hypothetical protein